MTSRPAVELVAGEASGRMEGVEVRQLMNELLGAAAQRRVQLVREERFRSLALAELLIAESERFEELSPAKSEELAELARRVADRPWILVRSYCLQANARRMAGDRQEAEACFRKAAAMVPRTVVTVERGFYYQRLAGLREEQGRADEAGLLLWRAVEVFRGERTGQAQAEAVCLCRLGFLALREGAAERAGRLFSEARALLPAGGSVLAARCGLGLALCLAALGQAAEARRLREESRRSGGGGAGKDGDAVPDPRSLLELDWLEGRLAAVLGEHGEAVGRLSSVRRRLFVQRRLLDTALCSLDLAQAFAAMDQGPRIRELMDELRRAFPVSFEQSRADLALNDYAEAVREGRDLERAALEAMDLIRRPLAILRKL